MSPWSNQTTEQLQNVTTEQFFTAIALNPGETFHGNIVVDFPSGPTDNLIVAVYTTAEDTPGNYDDQPLQEFTIPNTTDPHQFPLLVTGVRTFRIGVRRDGTTDTIPTVDLVYATDGVDL